MSLLDTVTEMARFGLPFIQQTVRMVFSQNDFGQLEWLLTEIPVSHESVQ